MQDAHQRQINPNLSNNQSIIQIRTVSPLPQQRISLNKFRPGRIPRHPINMISHTLNVQNPSRSVRNLHRLSRPTLTHNRNHLRFTRHNRILRHSLRNSSLAINVTSNLTRHAGQSITTNTQSSSRILVRPLATCNDHLRPKSGRNLTPQNMRLRTVFRIQLRINVSLVSLTRRIKPHRLANRRINMPTARPYSPLSSPRRFKKPNVQNLLTGSVNSINRPIRRINSQPNTVISKRVSQ